MISVLWSTRNEFPSNMVRYLLGSESSHVSLLYQPRSLAAGIVLHTSPFGTRLEWYPDFKKHNKVIWSLKPTYLNEKMESRVFDEACDTFHGTTYDYSAFSFWTKSALAYKFLGTPLPTTNKWQNSELPLCTQLILCLKHCVRDLGIEWDIVWPRDMDMVAPDDLYTLLSKSKYFDKH